MTTEAAAGDRETKSMRFSYEAKSASDVKMEPLAVDFSVSDQHLLSLLQAERQGKEEQTPKGLSRTESSAAVCASADASELTTRPFRKLQRRNSTGTVYVSTTMMKQDNKLTIDCVCIAIRAHMISAAKEGVQTEAAFDVFKDAAFRDQNETSGGNSSSSRSSNSNSSSNSSSSNSSKSNS